MTPTSVMVTMTIACMHLEVKFHTECARVRGEVFSLFFHGQAPCVAVQVVVG